MKETSYQSRSSHICNPFKARIEGSWLTLVCKRYYFPNAWQHLRLFLPVDRNQDRFRSSLVALPRSVCLGMFRQEVACGHVEKHWKIQPLGGPTAYVQTEFHPYKPHRANHSNVRFVIFKCLLHDIKRNIFFWYIKIKNKIITFDLKPNYVSGFFYLFCWVVQRGVSRVLRTTQKGRSTCDTNVLEELKHPKKSSVLEQSPTMLSSPHYCSQSHRGLALPWCLMV